MNKKYAKCADCARRGYYGCSIMKKQPEQKFCFMSLDQAIKTEEEIIEYIETGKYPHHSKEDIYYYNKAVKHRQQLLEMAQ